MNTPPMPWRWAFAALVAGGLAACGTSSATSDAGAPLDAGPSDDATVGDSPNGFDANVARYDGPTPVRVPCEPPCALDQYCYVEHITGGRAPFDEAGADGGDAGDAGSPDAADAEPADAAPSPGCYADPAACAAIPTCACVLANVGPLGCDQASLSCAADDAGRPTITCTINLP